MSAGFTRRGACPALAAPMRTGDGLLARLNPVAAGLAPETLIGLCRSAARHGNGIVEVTARGSIQIRGLTASSAALLAGDVAALGIEARTGVPVETGPLAGLDPGETADPRPLAAAIRAAIAEAGLSGRLGPKVSVVIDGGGRFSLAAILADVRLTAERHGGETHWRLAIGGDAATARPIGLPGEADACADTVEVLRLVAKRGSQARARELAEEELKSLRSGTPPSGLPAISPSRGEIGSCDGGPRISALAIGEGVAAGLISPLEGEMAGRPEGRATERDISTHPESPSEPPAATDSFPIGIFPLSDSTHALAVALPFGSMPAERLAELARQAAALGATEIRPAPARMLLCLGLASEAAARLRERVAASGFVTLASDPRLHVVACPGAPACASAHLPARAIAEEAAASGLPDGSFTLHVSGCAKGCAHPGPAALTLVGGENGAGLVVNGTAKSLPAGYASLYDAARGLGRVAALAAGARRENETAAACLARLGETAIVEAFGRK